MRVPLLALALAAASVGCADSSPEAPPVPPPPATPVRPEAPDPPDTATVPGAPVAPDAPPASGLPPAPPAPEADQPRSPAPVPPTPPSPRRTEAAEAFWSSFRAAIRAGDRAAIKAGLADVVTVGEVEYRRTSPQVQSVLEQIVENEQVRAAYLSADRLVHGPEESAFSSIARVETPEGDVTEARLSGALREVAPGDWRLVRLRTDPVR